MRLALALGLVAVLAAAAGASAHDTTNGVPRGFNPVAAAAVGTRDLWVLGGHTLLRSTDAGRYFRPVAAPPVPSQGTVPTVVFANARDGFAYVADGSSLYATHDGGTSWDREGPAGDVTAFAASGGYAYLVVGGHRLERSAIGQDAWRRLTLAVSHLPSSLAARGSNVWFLGPPRRRPDFDTVALSSDRGRAFTAQKGPCLSELGGTLVPAAGGVVWAVCPTGMMAELRLSTNGGRSFPGIRSFHDPGGIREPAMTNGARIAAASSRVAVLSRGGGGALLRTVDAGRHWSRVRRTARIRAVYWLAFTTRRVGTALVQTGAHTTQLWRSTDAGATWVSAPIR